MTNALSVLFIYDSEKDVSALVNRLREGGYDVIAERADTAVAVRAALDRGVWDIVIADTLLAQYDGLNALQLVKHNRPNTPFIVVSNAVGDKQVANMIRAGARDFLLKDDTACLVDVVKHALRETEERREHMRAQEEIQRLSIELERRVQERTAQLEATNRELESFAYSVSHDLRAPLRAINGFGNIVNQEYSNQLDPEGQRIIHTICSETMRMAQLIDGLLEFVRCGRMTMQQLRVEMASMAQRAFDECVAQVPGRDIQLKLHPLPATQGDSTLLRQVWDNLISNAVKYTRTKSVAEIEITGHVDGDELVYCVKDNGVGFDMQYAHKLFGVFQRLHSEAEFEGAGVGLALVQRIVERHGGRIWAEAKPDEGATLYFTLPAKRE